MKLLIKKLYPEAITPSYGSEYAAGIDLCAYGEHIIKPRDRLVIPTGICIEWVNSNYGNEDLSKNYYLRIAPRSGLSVKHSIDIGAGVIDYDYRGEIKVCFINNSNTTEYKISHGDRIAQMILEKIARFEIVEEVEELSSTTREAGGFGSTGV